VLTSHCHSLLLGLSISDKCIANLWGGFLSIWSVCVLSCGHAKFSHHLHRMFAFWCIPFPFQRIYLRVGILYMLYIFYPGKADGFLVQLQNQRNVEARKEKKLLRRFCAHKKMKAFTNGYIFCTTHFIVWTLPGKNVPTTQAQE